MLFIHARQNHNSKSVDVVLNIDEAWLHQSNRTCPDGSKFSPGYLRKWQDCSFQGGHQCGACHNVSDAQVKKRKCFVKRKQNSRITMNVYLYTLCWRCVGFIYVALDYSRHGWYCGVNAFLGNAFCLVIGLQYPLNGLYNWFCNRPRYYWRHWMVLLSSSMMWILVWARLREWPRLSYWVRL